MLFSGRLIKFLAVSAISLGAVANAQIIYKLPWLAGQQELIAGLQDQPLMVLGLYYTVDTVTRIDGLSGHFRSGTKTSRLGFADWSVQNTTLDQKAVKVLRSTANYRQELKQLQLKGRPTPTAEVMMQRTSWVSPDGKILREEYSYNVNGERHFCHAVFGEDSITMHLINPKGQTSTLELNPDGGVQGFHDFYKPMLKDGKVTLESKEFRVLTPINKSFASCSIKHVGRFEGTIQPKKYAGYCFEIKGPNGIEKAMITPEGRLIQVDVGNNMYLQIED